MKQNKHKRLVCLALALGLLLSACGEKTASGAVGSEISQQDHSELAGNELAMVPQTTQSPQEQTGYGYTAEWSELTVPDGMVERLFLQGEKLLAEVSLNSGSRGVYVPETGEMLAADNLPGDVLAIAPGRDNLWYCVDSGEGLSIARIPVEGGLAEEMVPLRESEQFYPYSMAVDGDGSMYLLGAMELRVYNVSGKLLSSFSMETERGVSLVTLSGGQVVLSTAAAEDNGFQTGRVKLLNIESIGASLTDQSIVCRAYPGWSGMALLNGGGGLYTLDTESGAMEAVLDWIDTDISPEDVVSVAARDQETIYLLSSTQAGTSLGTLTRMPAEKRTDAVINVGHFLMQPELSGVLSALAVEFNQSQSEFRVHLVNYRNYRDGNQRLAADAAELDLMIAGDDVVTKAELTDLTALFDEDVGEGTILPGVYRGLVSEGGVTMLPQSVALNTCIGVRSILGENEGWTPAEFADVVRQHQDVAVIQYGNAYDALTELLQNTASYVTDYASLLEAVRNVPVEDEAIYDLPANLEKRAIPSLLDGTLLVKPVQIGSFTELLGYQSALGEELVLKGYPVNTGNGGALSNAMEVLAIPAASAHKQEAWTFLKEILTDEAMTQYQQSCGFPILEETYARAEDEAMQGLSYTDDSGDNFTTGGQVFLDGENYEVVLLNRENADAIREYLSGVSGFSDGGNSAGMDSARTALETVIKDGTDPAEAAKGISY